jgi:hypothetical protein
MCSIRLTVGRSVVTSISSAAEGVLRVANDESLSPEDDDEDDVEYRPSTRPERHHAPTRWRGTSPAFSARHLRRGATAPAAKMTSRADTEDLSLPPPRDDDDGASSCGSPAPPAAAAAVIASDDDDDDAAAAVVAADADEQPPSAPVVPPSGVVTLATTGEAGDGTGGSDAAPRPPLAMLPSIHVACSRTAASPLDSSDTIMGTASA